VHSSAVGQDSSGSAVSVSPASMDLHKGEMQADCQPSPNFLRLSVSKQMYYVGNPGNLWAAI
jgi:hypothetical protein